MFCKKCGHQLENENASYCSNCGAPVKGTAASSTESFVKEKMQTVSNLDSRKKVFIALAIVAVIIIFATIKLSIKSDEERIVGTWIVIEEMYNGPQISNYGNQVIFEKEGMVLDEEQFLRQLLSAGVVVSWHVLENNNMLVFTNDWGEQYSADYELKGNKLKIIKSENTYCVLKKQ